MVQLANYKSWNLFIFERLPCLHGNLDSCHGRNTGGEDRPTNRHDIHAVAIYRDAEIEGHVPYNLALLMGENKAFAEIKKSQELKSTRELAMVWKSHVSTVYMDLTLC